MNKNDFTEFKKYLTSYAEISPAKKSFTAAGIAAYFSVLEDLTIDEFKIGLKEACKNNKFFPAPAEIISCVNGSKEQKEADLKIEAESQAMEAWERLCCRGGVGLELTDRAKATIQAMGGWEANGKGLESDGKWWRKQFSELYCGMSEGKKQDLLENSGAKRISDRSGGAVSAFDIKELPFADWGEE